MNIFQKKNKALNYLRCKMIKSLAEAGHRFCHNPTGIQIMVSEHV
jgi:hypothetical protein